MSEPTMQINVKIPRVVALGAKRLARYRGVTLNVLVADILLRELQLEADSLLEEVTAEELAVTEEFAAIRQLLSVPGETQGTP